MLRVGRLSAGFGDFDLVAGIDPSAVDEMGAGGGEFDERIGLCGQLAGKGVGFPSYFGPDFLVAIAGRDGEVRRWRRVAQAAGLRGTPTFALLQTTRRPRLLRWRGYTRNGRPISIEAFGTPAVTRAVLLGREPGLAVPLLPD